MQVGLAVEKSAMRPFSVLHTPISIGVLSFPHLRLRPLSHTRLRELGHTASQPQAGGAGPSRHQAGGRGGARPRRPHDAHAAPLCQVTAKANITMSFHRLHDV